MVRFEDIKGKLDKYEFLILDFDGTLVKLDVDWGSLKKHLQSYVFEQRKQNIDFSSIPQALDSVKKKINNNIYKSLLSIIEDYEAKNEIVKINYALVKFLNETKKPFAIYSMNNRNTIKKFLNKYLKNPPLVIISRETYTRPKPSELDIIKIIKRVGVDVEKAVLVGDSDDDYKSGKLARIATFIVKI